MALAISTKEAGDVRVKGMVEAMTMPCLLTRIFFSSANVNVSDIGGCGGFNGGGGVGECGRMVAMIVLVVVVCIKVFVSWCRFIVHEAA